MQFLDVCLGRSRIFWGLEFLWSWISMTWLSDMFVQLQGSKLAVVVSDFLQKNMAFVSENRKKSPYRCHQLVSGVDLSTAFEKWQVSRRESVKIMNAVWELKRWRDVPSSPSRWQWHPKNFEVLAHWMAPVGVTRLILRIFLGGSCFGLSFFFGGWLFHVFFLHQDVHLLVAICYLVKIHNSNASFTSSKDHNFEGHWLKAEQFAGHQVTKRSSSLLQWSQRSEYDILYDWYCFRLI